SMRELHHYVAGNSSRGIGSRFADVFNPNTGEIAGRVNLATRQDAVAAIEDAARAFPSWADTPVPRRAPIMFQLRGVVRANLDDLAVLLASEHGKVIADAKGDVLRGLDVVEFACGIPHMLKGEYSESVSGGMDVFSMKQPLGVVAGITPFNFPAMVPM